MTINTWPLDAVSGAPVYAGRALRQTTVALFAPMGDTARPLGGLSGVRWGTPVTTVTATSTTWTCGPHAGVIDGEAAAQAGPYGYSVDANVTGAVTAADGTNPRVDIVYGRISDPSESDGSSTPKFEVLYLAGTAAATPAPPATPARSFVLAQINVPRSGGGSPSVSWVAPWLSGSQVGFQTHAQLAAWSTAPVGTHATVLADASAMNGDYVRSGSAWIGGTWSLTTKLGTGWTAAAGGAAQAPRIFRSGNVRMLFGGVLFGTGASTSNILTVDPLDQPPTASIRTVGMALVDPTAPGSALISQITLTAGKLASGATTGSLPAGTIWLTGLMWNMD